MKNLSYLLLMALVSLTMFSSCRKDIINENTSTTFPTPEITVVTDLAVMVLDEDNQTIANADVQLSSGNYSTDDNGIINLSGVKLNKDGAIINVSYNGYYDIQKVITPKAKNHNYVRVKLMKKELAGSFQSSESTKINVVSGGNVSFPENAISYENGNSYEGEVNVYARHLNPTSPELNEIMPGNLSAINSQGEEAQLATYGMTVVELETPSGEKLQVAEGKEATIEMPVPVELLADAPTTIPLWHYDNEKGKWIEEGEAKLQGDSYTGKVSHFSFWNCDVPFDLVNFEARFVDDNSAPLAYNKVKITTSNASAGYDVTDEQGYSGGKVPANVELTLELYNDCNEIVYTTVIPATNVDIDLGTITIETTDTYVNLTGQILDCDNNPVENSYAIVTVANASKFISTDNEGQFDISVNFCSETDATLIAVDEGNLKQKVVDFTIDQANPMYDFGQITACDVLDEYITINTDYPINATFVQCIYNQSPQIVEIHGLLNSPNDSLVNFTILSAYPEGFTGEADDYAMIGDVGNTTLQDQGNYGVLTITKNDGSGGYIEGNIVSDSISHSESGSTITTSGTVEFRIKID